VIAVWVPHYLKTTDMPLDAVRPQRPQGRRASYALAGAQEDRRRAGRLSGRYSAAKEDSEMDQTKPRIGPTMRTLADVVSALPGCSKRGALRAAGLPECGMGHARPLSRAINAGLIFEDRANPWVRRRTYALFATERDRRIFNLRQELLHGSPSPERAEKIRAEVERLRQEQAASWTGE
jgi:hypothetical protein